MSIKCVGINIYLRCIQSWVTPPHMPPAAAVPPWPSSWPAAGGLLVQFESKKFGEIMREIEVCDDAVGRFLHV